MTDGSCGGMLGQVSGHQVMALKAWNCPSCKDENSMYGIIGSENAVVGCATCSYGAIGSFVRNHLGNGYNLSKETTTPTKEKT